MIKRIFFDIDETLIHTSIRPFEEGVKYEHFVLPDDSTNYYTIIRPCAKALIDFSRDLIGADNVYILTTSTKDYANRINELAGWGFETDHIIAREDIASHSFPNAYSGMATCAHAIAHKDNVLIDNLPSRYNESKTSLIGIGTTVETNYKQIRDYYGVD